MPKTSPLPLAGSARIVADKVESSDTPDNCFRNLLVVGPAGMRSTALAAAERRALAGRGWRLAGAANADDGAYAPGDEAFVSFSRGERQISYERAGIAPWSETMGAWLRAVVHSGRPTLAVRLQRG